MRRALVVLCVLSAASPASADQNDLVLSRLSTKMMDGNGNVTSVVAQNLEMRGLASQLGVVLAPHLLTPADTLGFGGFQLTVDYATTTVDTDASYWRALEGGQPDNMMRTVGLF